VLLFRQLTVDTSVVISLVTAISFKVKGETKEVLPP